MRLITRIITFSVRGSRNRRTVNEEPVAFDKVKLTQEQITEMGQYRMDPRARNIKDIFKDKYQDKLMKDYLKEQKDDLKSDKIKEEEEELQKQPKREKTSKEQKKEKLKTFKIYKHIDRLKEIRQKKVAEATGKDLITSEERLRELSRVRLIQQYLPFEYMKKVQSVLHKYDQTTLRNIAFHFTNLMKLKYNEEKIDYDQYEGLEFQKLQEKLPFHRKVEQIYLTSKEKALEVKEEGKRKIEDNPQETEIKYSQNIIISYLLNRVPRTYAVAYRTMHQIKKMFNEYSPTSFIDFGAGLSSGSAAFVEVFGDSGSVFSVEPVGKMRKLAKYLTDYSKIAHFESLAELSSQVKQVDIVYCGYVLNELKPDLVVVYLEALYAKVKPQGFLILTEYGNPFGARLIHQSRRWALTKKVRIAAPCPHHMKCPLSSSKHWCHFDQPSGMLPRQVFGKLPNEHSIKLEKYSYIIIQKLQQDQQESDAIFSLSPPASIDPNESHEWDRVLFPLMKKGQHFHYSLCTRKGNFEKRITSKSHGLEYKEGRKLKWGDLWRFGLRIPNRYRKERRTGKRLW